MVMIDKTNGNILYRPYFPLSAIYNSNNELYGKMLESHISAEMYIIENGVSKERYDEFAEWKKGLSSKDLKDYNFICQVRRICLFDFYEELKTKWKRVTGWLSLNSNQLLEMIAFSNVDYNEWNW